MTAAGAPAASAADLRFMRAALALGRRHLGETWPNPAVGALIVRDGIVVGRGMTKPGGRPHAETEALAEAGERARGATLYVTLEPCSHHGRTPPCADAIVRAGVARVVSALEDPDPRVAGRGHDRLREAGIELVTGVLRAEACRANLGHVLRITQGRPLVTLKIAETADGFAAGTQHDARLMITGLAANNRVQVMRAMHDAIMIGFGTAQADDPLLTVRLPGLERRPLRVVLDTHLRLSLRSRLAATARDVPTLVIAGPEAPWPAEAALRVAGILVERVACGSDGHVDLAAALRLLAGRGITRVMSEGGPTVGSRLVEAGLVEQVALFTAPRPLLREGVPALESSARAALADPQRFRIVDTAWAGVDRLTLHERIGACSQGL